MTDCARRSTKINSTISIQNFALTSKLILCKIFDEQETGPGKTYELQRFGDAEDPETTEQVVKRMNKLYRRAEDAYLALPKPSEGPAFEVVRVPSAKIAYVVGRIEGISVTRNSHHGDLLGEFFEQIVSQDFTQSKGQFFTPPKVVRFMLALADVSTQAKKVLRQEKDHLGRPRLPYVIDPSCGSGTFLIEYMKEISATVGTDTYGKTLPDRISDIHAVWFGGRSKNIWAKDFLFGVENNYDLGIAAKVNMVLHGDGSMNTYIRSGLLPFPEYWMDGRHNVLGVGKESNVTTYEPLVNEQFDFLITNPPFSLTASPDEKRLIEQAFNGQLRISEVLFIERWYQLLRPGGTFCAILPENILDTKNNKTARWFLLKHFKIEAIVSLPYDAFKPFTSTKTCIVYAQKRQQDFINKWDEVLSALELTNIKNENITTELFKQLDISNETIFMAEPPEIGYKRRKNLPDLERPNLLYHENAEGYPSRASTSSQDCVLDYWKKDHISPHAQLGFRVSLQQIVSRPAFRMDPKYCWLWYFENGCVSKELSCTSKLSDILSLVDLPKIKKQTLPNETPLIDLDLVASRQGTLSMEPPIVEEIGSDRVVFEGADILFSKLEPYLGKILFEFPEGAIGSPEWIGFVIKSGLPKHYVGYLLMHPVFCEAFRRLQSGKRHARLDPMEMLELKFELHDPKLLKAPEKEIIRVRDEIDTLLKKTMELRTEIDSLVANTAGLRTAEDHKE